MNYDFLHESEDIILRPGCLRSGSELWRLLKSLEFTRHGEVFSYSRPKKPRIPIWQSNSLVAVHVYRGSEEIYYPGKQWDLVKLRYLLATQPRTGIPVFSDKASEVADRLGLPMLYCGETITRPDLETVLNNHADELAGRIGEPGSEEVSLFIYFTYPRDRRKSGQASP